MTTIFERVDEGVVLLAQSGESVNFPSCLPGANGVDDWLVDDLLVKVSGLRSLAVAFVLVAVLVENEFPPRLTISAECADQIREMAGSMMGRESIEGLVARQELVFVSSSLSS